MQHIVLISLILIKFIFMSFGNQGTRYQRLSNTLELKNKSFNNETNFAETIKLPTLNAINKSVKYNNLSFMTSRDLNKLRKEPEQPDNIEEVSAHCNLMVIRKKYDHISKQKDQLQKQIEELQIKKAKFLLQKNLLEESKNEGKNKVIQIQENLQSMKNLVQESQINKKVMLNMIERIKQDKIVYDLRKYNYEKDMKYIKTQKQIILKESSTKAQEEDNTKRVLQKLLSHLQAEKKERQNHIKNINDMINEKVHLVDNTGLRKSQLIQIAENALQDKDSNEKNWYKVYLCQKFVQKVLIAKVNREMMKFSEVQIAFKNIKLATGVNDTDSMVKKFLNKEAAYGQLLSKITQDQRQIISLKVAHQDLLKERRVLQGSNGDLSLNKKSSQNLSRQEKQYELISQKAQKCSILSQKLKDWLFKSVKKFNSLNNKNQDYKQSKVSLLLNRYLQILNESWSGDEVMNEQQKYNANIAISNKNRRVQYRNQEEQNNNRNKTQNIDDQEDYINTQRLDLIRSNEKFMKELRKKAEEIKKARLQAEPKKKEVVVQKPKVAVQQ